MEASDKTLILSRQFFIAFLDDNWSWLIPKKNCGQVIQWDCWWHALESHVCALFPPLQAHLPWRLLDTCVCLQWVCCGRLDACPRSEDLCNPFHPVTAFVNDEWLLRSSECVRVTLLSSHQIARDVGTEYRSYRFPELGGIVKLLVHCFSDGAPYMQKIIIVLERRDYWVIAFHCLWIN